MNIDDIVDRLARFETATTARLHLIASENQMPADARLPYVSAAAVRYCFGSAEDTHWAWPGRDELAELESVAAHAIGELLGAQHVNTKPVSGLSAMTVALSALAGPAHTVLSLAEADGGHGSTQFVAHRFGLNWQPLPVDPATMGVDLELLASQARRTSGPVLVYLDSFMALFPHDIAGIRAAVGEDAVIHYDGSHTLGLIAGGAFQNPLGESADSLGGSVHKTWPGPVGKGIVATNDPNLAHQIDIHAAGWISHHHPADVAALAISTAWMTAHAAHYATATVANARRLADTLAAEGFTVCAADHGYTRSHQVWIDIAPTCPADTASRLLYEAGIVVNAIPLPYLPEPGLRLGAQELTFAGLDAAGFDELAALMARVLIHRDHPEQVARNIADLRIRYGIGDAAAADHTAQEVLRRGWRQEERTS
ncbi:hypothetical protein IU487_34255 [Nocardia puris]|uniref:hypothetical protein n=1 Tax=Nocardia puris TaxID=208602 RepID=UPI0018936F36|nr:hypothetical protein [Nocardia puris]MBF6216063.1 hypothetical protein [Nocardia puris]